MYSYGGGSNFNPNIWVVNPVMFTIDTPTPNINFDRTPIELCDAKYDCECSQQPQPTGPLRTIFVKWS